MKRFSLNRNQLKYIVIVAMLIDHIAWGFVPTLSWQGQAMHFIGRLTGPTMAYFLAEGYLHTRDVKRYALRLGLFALISWPAMTLFEFGKWPDPLQSVIYTLFLGLLAVLLWERAPVPQWAKLIGVGALLWLSRWGDWPVYDVLWPLFLVIYRDQPKRKWLTYWLICLAAVIEMNWGMFRAGRYWWRSLFQVGILMAPVLLMYLYNGEPGSRKPFHKWFFYVFYPAHLLVLAAIKYGWFAG